MQRLAQECNEENQDVALLENALEQDREEVGRLDNNEWLFDELGWDNAAEAPKAPKCRDLKMQLVTTNTSRAVALCALEEGVVRLVALERELHEKAAQLAEQRYPKRLRTLRLQTWCCRVMRGTQSGGRSLPMTN